MRSLVIALALLAAPAARANYEVFRGFSTDGALYGTSVEPGGLAYSLCLTDPVLGAKSWPADFTKPPPGQRCAFLCEPGFCKDKERARLSGWVSPSPAVKSGEHGETWSIDQKGPQATLTLIIGGQRVVMLVGLIGEATVQLGDIFWRDDGTAVALHLDPKGGAEPTDRTVVVQKLPRGGAGRAVASAAVVRARRAWGAGRFDEAAEELRKAIRLDPSYPGPHYGLAIAAALQHDATTARAELIWLSKSKDPEAKGIVADARGEPLLAFATLDPEVRKALGLPPWASLTARQRLLEGSGRWSLLSDECDRTITLAFAEPPTLRVRRQEQCKGKPAIDRTYEGTWKPGPPITVDVPQLELWPGAGTLSPSTCPELKIADSCFVLNVEPIVVGPFRRGLSLRSARR